ncbi:MAG: hypothetical protein SH850_26520 [Planctomycetaceae bacterium]|nr:hypothetical protein [Planctomycetaceae bacterium]
MNRLHALALVTTLSLLASAAAFAAVPASISVSGTLNGGINVSASCFVSSSGQASGAGRLFRTYNGVTYSYPFNINMVTTGTNTVILTGYTVANLAPVTLTATVPSGSQSFKYVVNGKTVTLTGQGTVTIQ